VLALEFVQLREQRGQVDRDRDGGTTGGGMTTGGGSVTGGGMETIGGQAIG
jgi:uncharacterized membrane protein YgcG